MQAACLLLQPTYLTSSASSAGLLVFIPETYPSTHSLYLLLFQQKKTLCILNVSGIKTLLRTHRQRTPVFTTARKARKHYPQDSRILHSEALAHDHHLRANHKSVGLL